MSTQSLDLTAAISASDHQRGPGKARVTIVEYADFQCPYCAQAHESLQAVLPQLPSTRLIFRHFPLPNIHPFAELAAEAAEAAGLQGRFWEMHDLLFEQQRVLDGDHILSFAETLGLDVEEFVETVNDRSQSPRVRRDLESGKASGVNGTPSFFINGSRHEGGYSREELIRAIERAR